MNLKKYLDAVNAASARVGEIARQIDEHFEAEETEQALELRPQLDAAKLDYEKANQLYLSMLNATSGGNDPAQRFVPAGGDVQVTLDEADQPFESDGHFFMAVKTAGVYPGREDSRLRSMKVKDAAGMSEGVPEDGGYLLRPQLSDQWLEKMYNTGEILSRVSTDPVGANSNSMTYKGVDENSRVDGSRHGGVVGYWVGEGDEITASQAKFKEIELKLRKVAALCYSTDEMLQDVVTLESWLDRVVPDELRFKAEDAIFRGVGGGQPLGIMNSPSLLKIVRVDANKIQFADVLALWARRYAGVRDYVWLINQDATPQIDQLILSGTSNQPTRFVDYGPDGVLRMKGRPVLEIEYSPTMGAEGDLMLASLSQYQTIVKGGIRKASSIHVRFVNDEQAFRFILRINGAPLWSSALTPYQGSNAVSPFVTLLATS